MFNIDLPYKSATPMKHHSSTEVRFKKNVIHFSTSLEISLRPFDFAQGGEKLLHPPSCTLDAVKVFKAP
jgi:hypothetical protein